MNNEEVFEVDAQIDSGMHTTPPPLYTPRTGQFATLSYGNLDPLKNADEQTPLLSGRFDHEEIAGRLPPGGGNNSTEEWTGQYDHEGKTWWNKPSVVWLLPPFLLFTLAFGGLIVPKLNLILSLICQEYLSDRASADSHFTFLPVIVGNDNDQCRIPEVQALVSKFTLYGNLIGGILCAISSPKLGAISDRYGRLRVVAFSTCGMFLGEVITIIAATFPAKFSVNWLLLGYATDGLCGSFIAGMAVSHAYASDCTAPSKRAATFGYFHGCLFLGIALGPTIAGHIIEATGKIITMFYIALCSHLIFICLLLFVLPESLTKERQLAAREKHRLAKESRPSTIWTAGKVLEHMGRGFGLFTPLKILWPTGAGSSRAIRRNLVALAAVDTTMFGVAMGSMTVVVIYSTYMFGWGQLQTANFVSIVNSCRVLCLLVVLPLIIRLVRGKASKAIPTKGSDMLDLVIIRGAILFDLLGYVGYAVATSGAMLTASGALAAFGGMGSPTLQSALTKHVPSDRTGELLGAMGLLHALARVVAPTIFNSIYAFTVVRNFPQAVFICLAASFGVAFVLSWFVRPHVHLDEKSDSRPVSAHEEQDILVVRP